MGDTLAKIAYEKAGIIKENTPIFTTVQDKEALDVILDTSITKNAPFRHLCIPEFNVEGDTIHFEFEFEKYYLKNQATYQVGNASLAISLVRALIPNIDHEILQQGLLNTHWAGRFETVMPGIIVDGAHNEMGVSRLIESIEHLPKPVVIVFAALKDKNFDAMISLLERSSEKLIVTEFDFYRAATAEELAKNHKVEIIQNYKDAIDYGIKIKEAGTLIVTGSLYFISDARQYLISLK